MKLRLLFSLRCCRWDFRIAQALRIPRFPILYKQGSELNQKACYPALFGHYLAPCINDIWFHIKLYKRGRITLLTQRKAVWLKLQTQFDVHIVDGRKLLSSIHVFRRGWILKNNGSPHQVTAKFCHKPIFFLQFSIWRGVPAHRQILNTET